MRLAATVLMLVCATFAIAPTAQAEGPVQEAYEEVMWGVYENCNVAGIAGDFVVYPLAAALEGDDGNGGPGLEGTWRELDRTNWEECYWNEGGAGDILLGAMMGAGYFIAQIAEGEIEEIACQTIIDGEDYTYIGWNDVNACHAEDICPYMIGDPGTPVWANFDPCGSGADVCVKVPQGWFCNFGELVALVLRA